jgi:peptidoglycan/LPS O-acetylase OafA/YrhL
MNAATVQVPPIQAGPIPGGRRVPMFELVRGLAALMVFAVHLTPAFSTLKPNSMAGYLRFMGAECVMVFFLLSGAVIGLSQENRAATAADFLVRRARRLLPLYVIACVFSLVVDWTVLGFPFEWRSIEHCLFDPAYGFRDMLKQGPHSNGPLWSLTFEVWYYLLFAVHLRFFPAHRFPFWWLILASAAFVVNFFTPSDSGLQSCVLVLTYSLLWLQGLACVSLARWIRVTPVTAIFFAGLALSLRPLDINGGYLDAGRHLLFGACLMPGFIYFLGGCLPWQRPSFREAALLSASYVLAGGLTLVFSHSLPVTRHTALTVAPATLGLALVIHFLCRDAVAPAWGRRVALILGRYSYALYLFHFVVWECMIPLFASPVTSALVTIVAAPLAAVWLETKVHPAILKLWDRWISGGRTSNHPAGT